jgi:hypothetical protein
MPGSNQRRTRNSPLGASNPSTSSAGQDPSRARPQPQSSRQMNPNAPTFYNQDDIAPDPNPLEYQQWAQGQGYGYMRDPSFPLFRQQQSAPIQEPMRHHVQQPPRQPPLQNQYNFAPGQYQPSPQAQPQFLGARQPQSSNYQQQPAQVITNHNEPFFYSNMAAESQQPVSHPPRPTSYQSFHQPQFLLNAPSDTSLTTTAPHTSSSDYLGFPANFHSASPTSDIPPKPHPSGPSPPSTAGASSSSTLKLTANSSEKAAVRNTGGRGKGVNKRRKLSEDSTSDSDDSQPPLNVQVNSLPAANPRGSQHGFATRL